MIRFAKDKDKEALEQLCVRSLPLKEKHFIQHYFEHEFDDAKVLISELDNLLVSQVHCREHVLHFMDKKLNVSYLFGIATHYDYRQRGIMRDLLGMQLEDCECNHLLTFLEASNPKLFERYGFDTIAYRKRYVVYAKDLLHYTATGVSNQFEMHELVGAYEQFSKVFDCFYVRDEEYYESYVQRVIGDGAHICVYRNAQNHIQGYAVYYELDDGIEVKEIIYVDKKSMCAMLKYAIGYTPFISIEVSQAEHLEKIFKMSIPRTYSAVMVRINQLKLFNKLFNSNCKRGKDIETLCRKPILINEKY